MSAAPNDTLTSIKEMIQACIQCGTCTGSCPNAFAMDHPPRQLWLMVINGQTRDVLASETFILCSSCYYCTLRCPRGLPLTDAMAALTRLAKTQNPAGFRKSRVFYRQFLESVRRHGRVNESELMALFFLEMKNPALPFQYAGLGIKFLQRKKISLPFSGKKGSGGHSGGLDQIFEKVRELENQA
jgi:heterodisulfide reductase subunit C